MDRLIGHRARRRYVGRPARPARRVAAWRRPDTSRVGRNRRAARRGGLLRRCIRCTRARRFGLEPGRRLRPRRPFARPAMRARFGERRASSARRRIAGRRDEPRRHWRGPRRCERADPRRHRSVHGACRRRPDSRFHAAASRRLRFARSGRRRHKRISSDAIAPSQSGRTREERAARRRRALSLALGSAFHRTSARYSRTPRTTVGVCARVIGADPARSRRKLRCRQRGRRARVSRAVPACGSRERHRCGAYGGGRSQRPVRATSRSTFCCATCRSGNRRV